MALRAPSLARTGASPTARRLTSRAAVRGEFVCGEKKDAGPLACVLRALGAPRLPARVLGVACLTTLGGIGGAEQATPHTHHLHSTGTLLLSAPARRAPRAVAAAAEANLFARAVRVFKSYANAIGEFGE